MWPVSLVGDIRMSDTPPVGRDREMRLAVGSAQVGGGSIDRKGYSPTMGGEVNAIWSCLHKCVFVTCLPQG